MKRVCVVVVPFSGHLNPMIALMRALRASGCKVSCLLLDAHATPLDTARLSAFCDVDMAFVDGTPDLEAFLRGTPNDWRRLLEDSETQARQVERAIHAIAPDLVLLDTFSATAVALAAVHRSGVPYGLCWANLAAVTPPEVVRDRAPFYEAVRDYLLPRGVGWSEATISPRAEHLNLVPAIRGLIEPAGLLDRVELVGLPGVGVRGDECSFDWNRIDSNRRLAYVSLGTLAAEQDISVLREIVAATERMGLFVVVAAGALADRFAGIHSDAVVVERYVPQREILARAQVFITHGGYNSVSESIRARVPMLVVPLSKDQPAQAYFVERAGLGLALAPAATTRAAVAAAVEQLLDPASGYAGCIEPLANASGDSASATAERVTTFLESAPTR